MDIKRPEILVILISMGVCIVCAFFIRLTNIMVIPCGLGLLVASVTYSIIAIKRYKAYKELIAERRYQDAYIYADEENDIQAMATFKYSKKTERFLKAQKFAKWLNVLSPIIISILSIVLLVVGIKVIFSA